MLNSTFMQWLQDKHDELQYDQESGIITEIAPPKVTKLLDQIGLVNELLHRNLENRYLPYPDMTVDDWSLLQFYARNYTYNFLAGNDSLTVLGNTALFREIVSTFEQRAIEWANGTAGNLKYHLNFGTPLTLFQILRGFNLSYYEWQNHLVPHVASSILIELYATHVNDTYSRANYLVSISIDDVPIPLHGCNCDYDGSKFRCPFDLVASFFANRSLPESL